MTLKRFRGKIFFECDECGEELDTDESDFQTAIAVFNNDPKGQNWETVRDGGEYKHYCTDCKEQI